LGRVTDFEQPVGSLEINHHKVTAAGPGMEVALKVIDTVREGDLVFKVVEAEEKFVLEPLDGGGRAGDSRSNY